MYNSDTINPTDYLTNWDRQVLEAIPVSYAWGLPEDHNPVTRELADNPNFIAELEEEEWFDIKTSYTKLSRLATLCQMSVYNAEGGPDGEGPQALRRHWYHWFKTRFAQPFANQIEQVTGTRPSDKKWEGRISEVYSQLVDEGATYMGLWVDDASRKRDRFHSTLFNGDAPANILLCVEKDSLYDSFKPVAAAIGARSITSGSGKNSRGSAEKILRDHFNWTTEHDPFTEDNPLIVLTISDWDYDGEAVIGPTFSRHMQRYTEHVREVHVGIYPQQVTDSGEEWPDKWYEIKVTNEGYTTWAEDKGLFLAECSDCQHEWPVQGIVEGETYLRSDVFGPDLKDPWPSGHTCPECGTEREPFVIKLGKEIVDQPHGFEVEAVPTRKYYAAVVDALLQVLDYDEVIKRLRQSCKADAWEAADRIQRDILDENSSYQDILEYLAEYERVLELKDAFENRVKDRFQAIGELHTGDWEDEDDDPDVEDFRRHAERATEYSFPWRPFSSSTRTDRLVEYLEEAHASKIEWFKRHEINWRK